MRKILVRSFYQKIEGYYLVHAGFNFLYPNPLSDRENMLWMRNWYEKINYPWMGENIIVHGHTPISREELEAQLKEVHNLQVINIDGGCVFKNIRPSQGWLVALNLEEKRFVFHKNIDF